MEEQTSDVSTVNVRASETSAPEQESSGRTSWFWTIFGTTILVTSTILLGFLASIVG